MKDEIVKETVQQSGTIAQRLFGPTADVIGAWMAQPLKERFARNQLERMLSLASKCENMRLPLRMLNLKTIYPYLEGIAIEEEPELQELWDNLMANYLDPDKHLHEESFPHVLKQLSTRDIRVLKFAYESGQVFYTYTSRFENQLNGQTYEKIVEDDILKVVRLGLF